jgi:hypothetical protein
MEFDSSVNRVSKFETLTSCAIASSLALFSASVALCCSYKINKYGKYLNNLITFNN